MKLKKFLKVVLVMNLSIFSFSSLYAQELQPVNMNTPSEMIPVTGPDSVVEEDGELTQSAGAKMLCDYFGLSPILLPKEENCTDPYIGRLKVAGIWEGLTYELDKPLSDEVYQELLEKAQECFQSTPKVTVYQERIAKSNVNFEAFNLGSLIQSKSVLSYGDYLYPLYEIASTSFIRVKDLEQIGLVVTNNGEALHIDLPEQMVSQVADAKKLEGPVKSNQNEVFIGNLKTYSIRCGEETLVPVRALGSLFAQNITAEMTTLKDMPQSMSSFVRIDEQGICNITDRPINLMVTSLYWDGVSVQKYAQHFEQLLPEQLVALPKDYFTLQNSSSRYITTLVEHVSFVGDMGEAIHYTYQRYDDYGQSNKAYFDAYTKASKPVSEPIHTELFPASIITGTMKYNTGALKKGEKVEVWAAEKGSHYTVVYQGKKVKVPWGSVSIPANPPVQKTQATKQQIEDYINSKGFTSKTDYLVWTDLHRQRTYILKKEQGQWALHKNILCSTGNNKTPTPRGEFTLTSYVPAFGMNKGYMCKNAVGIFEDYLYHSVMFDKTGSYQLSGVGKLGNQASSGCIRLSYEDSVWFYKNMPLGTKVWIN